MCERERQFSCVCVFEREKERYSERVCVCERERERVCVCVCMLKQNILQDMTFEIILILNYVFKISVMIYLKNFSQFSKNLNDLDSQLSLLPKTK